MPTILRFRGFNIVIYTLDHAPAHVHAWRGSDFVIFILNCPDGPVSVREQRGVGRNDFRALTDFVDDNVNVLCDAWRKLHGQ